MPLTLEQENYLSNDSEISFKDFKEIFDKVSSDESSALLIFRAYLSNPHTKISSQEFAIIINSFPSPIFKQIVANECLKNKNTTISFELFKTEILDKNRIDYDKSKVAVAYLANPNTKISSQEFIIIINSILSDDFHKIAHHLSNPEIKVTFEEFEKKILKKCERDSLKKLSAVNAYLANPNTKISPKELGSIITHFSDKDRVFVFLLPIVVSYLQSSDLSFKEFEKDILSKFRRDYGNKSTIVKTYLANPNTKISPKELGSIITHFSDKDRVFLLPIVVDYLQSSDLSFKEFEKDILSKFRRDDGKKSTIVKTYLENPNTKISSKELGSIITHFLDKTSIAVACLQSPNLKISFKEFEKDILSKFRRDDSKKTTIVKAYLESPNTKISSKELASIITHFSDKTSIIVACLQSPNLQISFEEFEKDILGRIAADYRITADYLILNIAHAYLSNPNTKISSQDFVKLIRSFPNNFKDDIQNVVGLYRGAGNSISLLEISKLLYPDEVMQVEFLKAAVTRNNLKDINLSHIKDDELVSEFITEANIKGLRISEVDVIGLCKGRFSTHYESLSELFKNQNVAECLTKEGLDKIRTDFAADFPETTPIIDLLSYYDLSKNLSNFRALLEPNLLGKIKASFRPSAQNLIVRQGDITKFYQLTGEDEEPLKKLFTANSKLCDKFLEVKIPEITDPEKFEINFGLDPKAKKQKDEKDLNQKLRKILEKEEHYTQEDVFAFFGAVLARVAAELPTDQKERKKLFEAWNNSKNVIATILREPGGIDNLIAAMTTLNNGCSANIGSQLSIIAYNALFKGDASKSALFQIASEQIFPAIFNRGDLISINSNPLTNVHVTSCYLSPEALLNEVGKKFKNSITAVNFIERTLGEKLKNSITLVVFGDEEDYQKMSEMMPKIAAYLTIEKVLGEEEAGKSESAKEVLKILEEAKNLTAPEEITQVATTANPTNVIQATAKKLVSQIFNKKEFLKIITESVLTPNSIRHSYSRVIPTTSLEKILTECLPESSYGHKLMDNFVVDENHCKIIKEALKKHFPRQAEAIDTLDEKLNQHTNTTQNFSNMR